MKFSELYERPLDRRVNPAVSASDLSDDTVLTEIVEYVFTPEIVANLYNILLNIKSNQGSHVGIWINGYFGSGKSHFLKYASYCLSFSRERREMAFMRLIEAAEEIMRKSDGLSALEQAGVSLRELSALKKWYVDSADVEMVMFNIGDVHDVNADQAAAFTTIFWNQFNAHRGYNSFNLAFAQYLEKALDDDGKFGEFKQYVATRGYNWESHITRFAASRLSLALEMAQAVDPALDVEAIRQRILNKDINVSVDALAAELKEYIEGKHNRNYRLLFFVDEVSQFIGEHRDLLLQLQSLVKRLEEVCQSQVWIACTAQQTLEHVVASVGGNLTNPEDEVGKILGRFEVRASLQGKSPEYITQRRILEKKPAPAMLLEELYEANKVKLDAQFVLPGAYRAFTDKANFAAFYPFVPYQMQLIMKVLDSFVNLGYVDRQVKGTERSLISITHSIVKETAEMEVGKFVAFDQFLGAMFQQSIQHLGRRAMEGATQAIEQVADERQRAFYTRVFYVLFMICNLSDVDKQAFSATIDNLVTLLLTEIDANKAVLKSDVAAALDFLMDKSVIRKVRTATGSVVYEFYTEEESRVAQLIKNQTVTSSTYTEELHRLIFDHFNNPSNKEVYATRSFSVGGNIDSKHVLANNADVEVDFLTTAATDSPDQFAFTNRPDHLVFFLYPQYNADTELRRAFHYYCQVQCFSQEPAISEERQRTKRLFQERARETYRTDILPRFQQILDTCPVIAGQRVLTAVELGNARRQERYRTALTRHLAELYSSATLVNDAPKTQSELSAAILRPVNPELPNMPLSPAEKCVKDFLDRQPHDVTVADVARQFARRPYGWSDFATIYTLNELVRRHLYAFNFNNNPDVSREETARNIVREAARFTVEKARAIPQSLLNDFVEAWKKIFNRMTMTGSNDSTELYRQCKEEELSRLLRQYRELQQKLRDSGCPFVTVIDQAVAKLEQWGGIRDHKRFFETVTGDREGAVALFDHCKEIKLFADDQLANYDNIKQFLDEHRDNFSFLRDDQQSAVEALRKMPHDMEPWERMQHYNKLMRDLKGMLQQRRSELTERIRAKYNAVFDNLDGYARQHGVAPGCYANREATITRLTATSNFYALEANANADGHMLEEQMKRINDAITARKPSPTPGPNQRTGVPGVPGVPAPAPAPSTPVLRKAIHLNVATTDPLRTEADVDLYLSSIKAELMAHIANGHEVIICQ